MIDFESKGKLPPGALVGLDEVKLVIGRSKQFILAHRSTFPSPIGRVALRNARCNKHWANVFDRAQIEAWGAEMQAEIDRRRLSQDFYRRAAAPEIRSSP